jgi:hypothetical protein
MSGKDDPLGRRDRAVYEKVRLQVGRAPRRGSSAEKAERKRKKEKRLQEISDPAVMALIGDPTILLNKDNVNIYEEVKFTRKSPSEQMELILKSVREHYFKDFGVFHGFLAHLVPLPKDTESTPEGCFEMLTRLVASCAQFGDMFGYRDTVRNTLRHFHQFYNEMVPQTPEHFAKLADWKKKLTEAFKIYYDDAKIIKPDQMRDDPEAVRLKKFQAQYEALVKTGTPVPIDKDLFIVDANPMEERNATNHEAWRNHFRKLADPDPERREKYQQEILKSFAQIRPDMGTPVKEEPIIAADTGVDDNMLSTQSGARNLSAQFQEPASTEPSVNLEKEPELPKSSTSSSSSDTSSSDKDAEEAGARNQSIQSQEGASTETSVDRVGDPDAVLDDEDEDEQLSGDEDDEEIDDEVEEECEEEGVEEGESEEGEADENDEDECREKVQKGKLYY